MLDFLITDSTGCAYIAQAANNQTLLIIAYIMAGLCVICLLVPMVFLYVHWQMEKCRDKPGEVLGTEDNGLISQNESDS